jgi:hypothetical protein
VPRIDLLEEGLIQSWTRSVVLPPAKEGGYPASVRVILTAFAFIGVALLFLSPFLKPVPGSEVLFWHRSYTVGLTSLVLVCVSIGLRSATKTAKSNVDWLRLKELFVLVGLALLVTRTDIHLSKRIGLLAYPPYYDGVGYMVDARYAFLHLGMCWSHPFRFAHLAFGSRYPVWTTLMTTNFVAFGVGEWQAYAVRFWPTLAILLSAFWVVRRRLGPPGAYGAAIFTAFLPTLSVNLRSAAMGHQVFPRGYLADVRPDLLFAAFLMSSVVLMIEHVHSFDEWTALLSGASAAFAVLAKSTTISAVFLACGIAGAYVLFMNREHFWQTLQIMLWGVLAFTVLLLPWLLLGGLEATIVYIRDILTSQLSRYSDAHPTLRTQTAYYWFFLLKHMGWTTVLFAVAGSTFIFLARMKVRKAFIDQTLVYCLIAAVLFSLVCTNPLKNDFFGLPAYLVLWIYCWGALASSLTLLGCATKKLSWCILMLAIIIAGVLGIAGVRGIQSWKGHEFEEGCQDRAAFHQMAVDLRQLLSNNDSFVSMPAYGDPATLLFYMPDRDGELPHTAYISGTDAPPVQEVIQRSVAPAKAVLVYANGDKARGWAEVGWFADEDFQYFRAIAAWVRRPASAYHLKKTYNLYPDKSGQKSVVELYVRDD